MNLETLTVEEIADEEYQRICTMIGRPPYGECELVALFINRQITNSRIVEGIVHLEDRNVKHFWVVVNNLHLDPLADDWISNPTILNRSIVRIVAPSEILDEYKKFIETFPEPKEFELFPLRWEIKDELID